MNFTPSKRQKTLPKGSKLASLSPFVDNTGILRVGGQIILPSDHHVTRLIIVYYHQKSGHLGPSYVLADLRQKYWIISGQAAIRSYIRKCLCKLKRARTEYPYMAVLPKCRLAYQEPPFSHCGVDLFGPLYIKREENDGVRYLLVCQSDAFISRSLNL